MFNMFRRRHVPDWLRDVLANQQEELMARFDELDDAVDGLGTAINDAVDRINADFQALKDQLATDATDQAAVDAATEKVQASIDALNSIDPNPANPPAPEPGPEPGPEPAPGV